MIYLVDKLPKHPTKRYGKRRLDQIKYIVVHHFAGNITIEEAAKLHISRWFPGIGYTIVIDPRELHNVTAYVTNDLDTICYGVAKNNTQCLSIAVRGNYDKKVPDTRILMELEVCIDDLRGVLGDLPVKCHSDFVATACPGNKLYDWVQKIYPSPQPLSIRLNVFKRLWNKWFKTDPDHPELV